MMCSGTYIQCTHPSSLLGSVFSIFTVSCIQCTLHY